MNNEIVVDNVDICEECAHFILNMDSARTITLTDGQLLKIELSFAINYINPRNSHKILVTVTSGRRFIFKCKDVVSGGR